MNIALMSHDNKKELMVQFCIAYCGILSKHTVCATSNTGRQVAEATGLFFNDPSTDDLEKDLHYIINLCDQHNVPVATNSATAEMLIHGLARGDLDWRLISHPTAPIKV